MMTGTSSKPIVPKELIFPFILVTTLFALWGFANDLTNPMVKAFSQILRVSNFQGALVQFAFYGGYFVMAFPAALFIKRFNYKSGILVGLGLYAVGGLLFIPASQTLTFLPFLIAYFILTCGLSFLETTSNPYILSMGPEETATRRLNFAQSFNPLGSLLGMFTAQQIVLSQINPASAGERTKMTSEQLQQVTASDLEIIIGPYVAVAGVIILIFIIMLLTRMPAKQDQDHSLQVKATLKRLFRNKKYYEGVVAQFFYIGAQIMCWTFIIHYATMELGMTSAEAQGYNIIAMILFAGSRFITTYLMKYFRAGQMLMTFAIAGMALVLGVIFIQGIVGLYCLIGVSACMSLMFPTIYGIALRGLGADAKFGAAGLIMAIVGGSVMPPLQGAIIDLGTIFSYPAVRVSFVLPLISFIVITIYGNRTERIHLKDVYKGQ